MTPSGIEPATTARRTRYEQ